MVILKEWEVFERDVISKRKKFYLYGVGRIYKKIINIVKEDVIAVIDKRAEEIKNNEMVIIKPEMLVSVSSKEILVLCLLNPFEKYLERTNEVRVYLEKCIPDEIKITIYCLNYKKIKETGLINWGGQRLLIDNMLCLTNSGIELPHMKAAYNDKKQYDSVYMKKLYEEPFEFVLYEKSVGLRDYDNGVITHKDGKKKTVRRYPYSDYEHTVWMFGDSRVSGMLIENSDTCASYLQKKMDENSIRYRVVNCGIPGRDIERMVYQICNQDIKKGDYVILGTGFYEYEGDAIKNAIIWSEYIKDAASRCNKMEANFMYINFPTILEMHNRSQMEEEMLELFHTTEFREYTYEKIRYYIRIIDFMCKKNGVMFYDFADVFQERHRYGHVFINMHHYGPHGNRLIADGIFEIFSCMERVKLENYEEVNKAKEERTNRFNAKLKKMRNKEEELCEYLHSIKIKLLNKSLDDKKIGCIVMNANPFTKGHLHLVKYALRQIDLLIVFVVSENESFFSFEDRFQLVYDNLAEYENVLVVPSGKFCISKSTFPEYFKKADIQEEKVNVNNDLEVFAEKIAPALNISVRFVGEENEDKITRQYNEAMKVLLPQKNIEVVEIPRKLLETGMIISASTVRKLIKEQNFETIEKIVPSKTYEFINNKYGKRKI